MAIRIVAIGLCLWYAGVGSAQTSVEFTTTGFSPFGVTGGPDNALWMTPGSASPNTGLIGRMTTAGSFAGGCVLAAGYNAANSPIVTGPDNNLWVAISSPKVGVVKLPPGCNGSIEYDLPLGGPINGMAVAGGDLWMTVGNGVGIVVVNTSGGYHPFPVAAGYTVHGIAALPGGSLYFLAQDGSGNTYLGEITLGGTIAGYVPVPGPIPASSPNPIAAAGGSLWYVTTGAQPSLVAVSSGRVVQGQSPITGGAIGYAPNSIALGPDGNLWVTGRGLLVRATTGGSEFADQLSSSITGVGIAAGADSNMWFADSTGDGLVCFATSASTCPTGGGGGGGGGGALGVTPASVSFSAARGQALPSQTLTVSSTSGIITYQATTQYSANSPANWINLTGASGTASPANPGSITAAVTNVALGFPPGVYTASITVISSSGNTPGVFHANASSSSSSMVTLTVNTTAVFGALNTVAFAQDPQTLSVNLTSGSQFTYKIVPGTAGYPFCGMSPFTGVAVSQTGVPWLLVNNSSATTGSASDNLTLAVQSQGLPPGVYIDQLNFTNATGSPYTTVYLYVKSGPDSLLPLTGAAGGQSVTQSFSESTVCPLDSSGLPTTAILGASSDQNWLSVSPGFGNLPATFTVSANPGNLAASSTPYSGTLVLTDTSGEIQIAAANFTVTSGKSTGLTPTTIVFTVSPNPVAAGGSVNLTATVTPSDATGGVSFTLSNGSTAGEAFLSSGLATTTAPLRAPGIYSLTATYNGDSTHAASTSNSVNLLVTGTQASTTTLTASLSTANVGQSVPLTATVAPAAATGTVTFNDGGSVIGSAAVNGGIASFSTASLAAGPHSLTAVYSGDTTYASSASSAYTVTVSGTSGPAIVTGGVLNAASFAKGSNGLGSPVAPGSLVAVYTSALPAQQASYTGSSLASSLGGVSLTIGNVTAPLVYVIPTLPGVSPPLGLVSAQVPFEALDAGQLSATVPVVITVNGVSSPAESTQIVPQAPGIFTNPSGAGNAILVNLTDGTIAGPTGCFSGFTCAPIARGAPAYFYATGLGAMNPAVADGTTGSSGLHNVIAMPTVLVGGIPVTPAFAGQSPYPGVYQVNITIPANVPIPAGQSSAVVSLQIQSADGTVTSGTGISTIAVR